MVFSYFHRCLAREKRERMSAGDALRHPWLAASSRYDGDLRAEKRQQVIPTILHRKFFKANQILETSTVVISLGRLAFGGSLRSYKGKSVAKLKIESIDMNPRLGVMCHRFVEEGCDALLQFVIYDPEGDENITW